MTSPTSRRWAMAMLTASTDRDPIRHELAQEVTPDAATHLAALAAGYLRMCAELHHRCPHLILAEMGQRTAEELEGLS